MCIIKASIYLGKQMGAIQSTSAFHCDPTPGSVSPWVWLHSGVNSSPSGCTVLRRPCCAGLWCTQVSGSCRENCLFSSYVYMTDQSPALNLLRHTVFVVSCNRNLLLSLLSWYISMFVPRGCRMSLTMKQWFVKH